MEYILIYKYSIGFFVAKSVLKKILANNSLER